MDTQLRDCKYRSCLIGDKYFHSGNYLLQSMKFPCFKIKFLLQSVPSRTYPIPLWVRHLGRSIYLFKVEKMAQGAGSVSLMSYVEV